MPKPKDNPFGAYREDETESDDMPEFETSWFHAFLLAILIMLFLIGIGAML